MPNMTNSQFATFRADVQRAARQEIKEQIDSIRSQICHGLRQCAIATAREAAMDSVTNLSNRLDKLERTLRSQYAVPVGGPPTPTVKLDVNGRVVVTIPEQRPKPEDGDTLTNHQTGEVFWWYRGEFRRRSELESYRDGLRACGL